jgi:hypothetical protein
MHTPRHHTLFRRCSHPLSSSSYVRCIVSAPSQASAMPSRLKCFISLSGLVVPPLSLSLYILCVLLALRHCYRNFPSFVATPPGIGGRPLYHFVLHPLLCYSPSYHWTVYTESGFACWCEATLGCLVRFFGVFTGSLQSSILYE